MARLGTDITNAMNVAIEKKAILSITIYWLSIILSPSNSKLATLPDRII
jgi:hypothetical protein